VLNPSKDNFVIREQLFVVSCNLPVGAYLRAVADKVLNSGEEALAVIR